MRCSKDTVACCALTANTEVKSSRIGGSTFVQCAPPSVVRRIVPAFPTIQQTVSEGAEPAIRSVVTPLVCKFQVAPVSAERSIRPLEPTRHTDLPFGAEIVAKLLLLASTNAVLCRNEDLPSIC